MPKAPSRKALYTHVFFFTLFLILPILVFPRLPGESFFLLTRAFVQDSIANGIFLIFFYVNYYILIPRLYFNHKYVQYISCVLIYFALALVLPQLLTGRLHGIVIESPPPILSRPPDNVLPPDHFQPGNSLPPAPLLPPNRPALFFVWDELRRHLYLFFTAIFFSFLLRIREHLDQIKEEKLRAEIASLKSQINPHFLFNTLNNIYTLALMKDDKASEAIIHLSGIMRYAIKDSSDSRIPLHKEIEYIGHYIELQKSRLGDTAFIIFECSGDPGEKEIAPLLLITYIENAFKYGISPDAADCIVEITLQITDTGIRLHTYNKKIQRSSYADSTGIGLSNTHARLQHLYPDRHTIEINENKETYSVHLSLDLS